MNCPLMVIEKARSITVVRNRELIDVPFHHKPYVLCQTTISNNNPKEYTDLYTKEKIMLGREEFDDLNEAREFYTAAGRRGVYFNSIKDQYLLDEPDYFRQYQQTEPLRILRIDIECLSDGSGIFPKPGKVPIIAIGLGKRSYPDPAEEPFTIMEYKDDVQDREMLEKFVRIWKEYNPDIVTGYNVWFDIEYIIGRLQKHKMGLSFLTRDGSMPFFQTKDGMRFNLAGRVVMDLFENVKRDQSLLGIKNRKLKTVCEKFEIPAISIDTKDMREIVNTEKLREYNISDIRVLDSLLNIYLPQLITLAEMIGLPLNDVINGYSSTIPKIYTGRRLISMGMIPLDNNEDRYGDTRFEAAYVDILKTGRFETVYKLDFASQYPTIMMTFNLGPDTVKLLSQEEYDLTQFSVTRNGDQLLMVIPDDNFQKNMVIQVDLSKDSFIREDMLKLYKMRAQLKRDLKISTGADAKAIESKSIAIKVLMNTIFGFEGLKYSRFGDMTVGVAIVGLARWLTKKAVDRIKDKVIEIDSVPGYTPVFVQENGMIDIIPIEDLHDIKEEKRRVYTGNYKVLSSSGWTDIIYTKCHKVEKNIHRVVVSDGFVDVTEDHSLFRKTGEEVKPKDLKRNDEILIADTPLPLDAARYTSVDSFSPNLAWAIGLFLAEGSISKQTVTKEKKRKSWKSGCKFNMSISMQDLDALNRAKVILETELHSRLGPICNRYPQLKIYDTRKSSATYRLEGFYNERYCNFFLKTCYCLNGKTKKIPWQILNSQSNDVIDAFIDGAMLGDGYITKLNNREQWCYTSHDWPLAAGFQYLMHRRGHLTRLNDRCDKPMVVSVRKRFPGFRGGYRNIHKGKVLSSNVLNVDKQRVYDISTEDGSFVSALGNIVLHNTDGVYLDSDVNVDEMNTLIAGLVAETVGQECYLKFEKEGTWVGYFYRSKNYILMEKDGTIIFHGVAFKSSKNAKLRDRFIQEVARATLMGANQDAIKELVLRFRDLSNYSLDDFIMHISLSKTKYKSGTMQEKLIQKAEAVLQRKVVAGESIDYFKTPDGYEVSDKVISLDQLDKDYYLNVIYTAQEIFGLQDVHKTPEEMDQEARQKRRNELIQFKRKLREYSEGAMLDYPEFSHMSVDAAKTEVERISTIQESILKSWSCPACSAKEGRELNYPDGIKCSCGWIGIPPRPPKKKRAKKTKEEVTQNTPEGDIPKEQWGERVPF